MSNNICIECEAQVPEGALGCPRCRYPWPAFPSPVEPAYTFEVRGDGTRPADDALVRAGVVAED